MSPRRQVEPLETLYDASGGDCLPLPPALAALYGRLSFPSNPGRAHVVANFVSTLDGVTVVEDKTGGGAISGFDPRDRMVMGLLRAVSDAVVVGAGTLRPAPKHLWTAEHIYPDLAEEYRQLRAALGKTCPPLHVVVSGSGKLDLGHRVFSSGEVAALIVTTEEGARRLEDAPLHPGVRVASVGGDGRIASKDVLELVAPAGGEDLVLVEGGPHLLGDFLGEASLDELFLTLAPQVAGRDDASERPGFVAGRRFLPDDPRWGTLVSAKRGGSHLFLRYGFTDR